MSRSGFPLRHILSDREINILRSVFGLSALPDETASSYAFVSPETYPPVSLHPKSGNKAFHAVPEHAVKRRSRARYEPLFHIDPDITPEVLADADVASATVRFLKSAGVKIQDVRKIGLKTASDEVIFEFAQQKKYLLITHDHDYIRHDGRFDIAHTAGVVILPAQPPWSHEPHTPAACRPLRRALHQFLSNLSNMRTERFGTVYEFTRGPHYRLYSANSAKNFFGQRIPDRTLTYEFS